jgi:hypothetical protein
LVGFFVITGIMNRHGIGTHVSTNSNAELRPMMLSKNNRLGALNTVISQEASSRNSTVSPEEIVSAKQNANKPRYPWRWSSENINF